MSSWNRVDFWIPQEVAPYVCSATPITTACLTQGRFVNSTTNATLQHLSHSNLSEKITVGRWCSLDGDHSRGARREGDCKQLSAGRGRAASGAGGRREEGDLRSGAARRREEARKDRRETTGAGDRRGRGGGRMKHEDEPPHFIPLGTIVGANPPRRTSVGADPPRRSLTLLYSRMVPLPLHFLLHVSPIHGYRTGSILAVQCYLQNLEFVNAA